MEEIVWKNAAGGVRSKKYVCGYCGNPLASNEGFLGTESMKSMGQQISLNHYIYICHFCHKPTYFDHTGGQTPGSVFGKSVEHLPPEVDGLYKEARLCYSAGAYTGSVLCSRKLLMNIAVSKTAKAGETFKYYVDWLAAQHYLPPGGEKWTEKIRDKGNDATHEIPNMKKEDAELLITFLEMLLRFVYEFPAKA